MHDSENLKSNLKTTLKTPIQMQARTYFTVLLQTDLAEREV